MPLQPLLDVLLHALLEASASLPMHGFRVRGAPARCRARAAAAASLLLLVVIVACI